jgi:F-type H+-transporting ATPase subunit gamma
MAKARAIVKRRKAVQNIRKITRTMQLIATARYQQTYNRAMASKPYTAKITELVEQLSGSVQGKLEHPLLKVNQGTGRSSLLVITSNRGLCGGYNSSVLRTAIAHLDACEGAGLSVDLHLIGKKGMSYFHFLGREATSTNTRIDDKPRFADIEPIAEGFIRQYSAGRLDSVHVAYMRFISTGKQRPEVLQLLPLKQVAGQRPEGQPAPPAQQYPAPTTEYDFSPAPEVILAELLPTTVKARLYQCFMDAAVSEQVARMVAMKSATEAAGDMIKSLTGRYNRARQSQITMELLDIMGGANALT